MKPKLLLLTVPLLALLAACGAGAGDTAPPSARSVGGGGTAFAPAAKPATLPAGAPAATADVPPLPSAQHLEINAALDIQIPRNKFQDDFDRVLGIIDSERGYLSASNTDSGADGPRSGTFTFQVPVGNYMEAMAQLRGIGRYHEHSTSKPHDAEYVDLQARLKSAQAQLAALNGLLAKATSIGDIIAIEQQIGPVQQQIEQYQGQLQYLDSLTQYATVTVTLAEKGAAVAPPPEPGFAATFRQVVANLSAIANAFLLVVGTLLPFLLLGALAFATRRRWLPASQRP